MAKEGEIDFDIDELLKETAPDTDKSEKEKIVVDNRSPLGLTEDEGDVNDEDEHDEVQAEETDKKDSETEKSSARTGE